MNRGTVTKESHQQKAAKLKTTHLLCIGINQYGNSIVTLNNAVRDARAFEKILKEKYGVTDILTLYDEAATLAAIIETFDYLREKLTKEDNLIIYFSGHGELVNNRGHWIPVDAVLGERHTYLYNHEIRDLLFDLKAHHVLVIADACFSGSLLVNNRSTSPSRYYTLPSRWVMTSGQIELVPDGLPGFHSPFAKSILTQLEYNSKAHLSVTELWVNMREGIIANSGQTPLCEPVKDVNHQGGEYYFIDKNVTDLPLIPSADFETNKEVPKKQLAPTIKDKAITEIPMNKLKRNLRKLQVGGKTKEAYELLMDNLNDNSPHMTTVYLRLADYNGLQNDIAQGIAMNIPQRKAQINHALDFIIQNMEEDDLRKD